MKFCPRCQTTKDKESFNKRAASVDGLSPACRTCINLEKRADYYANPLHRADQLRRTKENKKARMDSDPAYRRAVNLHWSVRRRTNIPPWVAIMDFYKLCKSIVRKGSEYELDHIVPLNHPNVCGLHVPWNLRVVKSSTNNKKGNSWS